MEIAVDGWRASAADWDAVSSLPSEQVPPLSREQREVAVKLGISELDYARSALAGRKSQEALLAKTERLARLLNGMLKEAQVPSSVERIVLRTFDEKFDVLLKSGQTSVPFKIAESVVDDLFENGSRDAEQRVARILETVVPQLRAQ
jgi:hypothetical protein